MAAMPGVVEVHGRGLLLGATLEVPATAVVDSCREQGLLVLSAGPDVLRLTPSLVITEDDANEALAVLADVLRSA
jgi:acetylornithine/succinyldiaminopimelate/putrescine aminotransferase